VSRIALAVLAAALVASAGSIPAAGQTPPGLPNVPGLPKPPRGTVSYLLHAEFGLKYEVEWTEESGMQFADCLPWRIDRGTNEVLVGSAGWLPGRIEIYPKIRKGPKTGGWATSAIVGRATASIHRTWSQRGSNNWKPACGGPDPGPFRPAPNDCGGGNERRYETPNAAVLAQMRQANNVYLKPLTTTQTPGTKQAQMPAFAISAVGRSPYQRCMTSGYAPEMPANIGFLLLPKKKWVEALRKLRPGEKIRLQHQYGGECTTDLPDNAACRFSLDVHIDIRRWKPGTRYP
jgi:hypothetical protein